METKKCIENLSRKQRVKKREDRRRWLRKSCFKRTTKALVMAAQEQATKVDKT